MHDTICPDCKRVYPIHNNKSEWIHKKFYCRPGTAPKFTCPECGETYTRYNRESDIIHAFKYCKVRKKVFKDDEVPF